MTPAVITGAPAPGRALAAIPSPSFAPIDFGPLTIAPNAIHLGPLTIHFYALCILAGVIVAVIWSERRWAAMGGEKGTIMDIAVVAVPFGLIGGRLYHVISDYQLYFLPNSPNPPIAALYIWQGGLGIWGAVPLGALGAWLVVRRRGLSLSKLSFAVAPGIAVAQAMGRWGNYFNQELFGAPTDLPWGLLIDPDRPGAIPGEDTYHPTFLYESLWCLVLAFVLVWAGKRFDMRGGRLFAVYIMGYTVGRFWIEYLRVDPANHILGFRLNNYTALIVFLGALAYFIWAGRNLDRFSTTVAPIVTDPKTPGSHAGSADGAEAGGPDPDSAGEGAAQAHDAPDKGGAMVSARSDDDEPGHVGDTDEDSSSHTTANGTAPGPDDPKPKE